MRTLSTFSSATQGSSVGGLREGQHCMGWQIYKTHTKTKRLVNFWSNIKSIEKLFCEKIVLWLLTLQGFKL